MDLLCFCSVLCLLFLCARLIICALWSPAGKGLTSWFSFVVSNCEFVTFPLVSFPIDSEGERILEYALAYDLFLGNTCFKKRDSHLITYRSGNTATQIDFM